MHMEYLKEEDFKVESIPKELEQKFIDLGYHGKFEYQCVRSPDYLTLNIRISRESGKGTAAYVFLSQYYNNCGITILGELKGSSVATEFLLEKAIALSMKMKYTKLQLTTNREGYNKLLSKRGFTILDTFTAVRTGNKNWVHSLSLQEV